MAVVAIRDVRKGFGTVEVIHGVNRHRGRRIRRPGRPVRLRKIDAAADDRRAGEISAGEIAIGERVVNTSPPKDRDIAMVFQNYALYPHMTVGENMGFALKLPARRQGRDRGARRPGGCDPRAVAAARPLSAPALRRPAPARRHGPRHRARPAGLPVRRAALESRRQAARRHAHRDQGTAPAAEDDHGLCHPRPDRGDDHGRQDRGDARRRVEQIGAPLDLYDRPDNLFVAGFIGSPSMNFLKARHRPGRQRDVRRRLPARCCRSPAATARQAGRAAVYGVRPEHIGLSDERRAGRGGGRRADRRGDPGVRPHQGRGDQCGVPRAPSLVQPGAMIGLDA